MRFLFTFIVLLAIWFRSCCFQEGCLFSPFGFWGEWSPCQHNGLSCGARWGHQTRTWVLTLKGPEELSSLCRPSEESRRCRMKKRCPKGEMGGGSVWTVLFSSLPQTGVKSHQMLFSLWSLPPTCTASVHSWLRRLLSWRAKASVCTEFT